MSRYFDPAPINERLTHFDVRLDDLLKQFTDYQAGLQEAAVRVGEHRQTCIELIAALRSEQKALAQGRGMGRWFGTGRQRRINTMMLDIMEHQSAILQDSWDAQATVPGLLVDTAVTIKRDFREVVEAVRTSLERLDEQLEAHIHGSIDRLGVDVAMLKELAAGRLLSSEETKE